MLQDSRRIDLTLEPLDDHVVVHPAEEETATRTGLIIPAAAEARCRTGIITAVGTAVEGVEPGDKVLFPVEAGYEVTLSGVEVRVLRREELVARIHD